MADDFAAWLRERSRSKTGSMIALREACRTLPPDARSLADVLEHLRQSGAGRALLGVALQAAKHRATAARVRARVARKNPAGRADGAKGREP